jgi:hypothetical protein
MEDVFGVPKYAPAAANNSPVRMAKKIEDAGNRKTVAKEDEIKQPANHGECHYLRCLEFAEVSFINLR